jgi:hypothetical protein
MRRRRSLNLARRASWLAPLEGRSPFVAERDDTLCCIVGGEDVSDRLAFEGESGVQGMSQPSRTATLACPVASEGPAARLLQ